MALDMQNANFLEIKGKWKYGNKYIGTDLTEIDGVNYLKVILYPLEITFISSFKNIGFGIKIFKINFSFNISSF